MHGLKPKGIVSLEFDSAIKDTAERIVGEHLSGKVTHYLTYPADVPKRDLSGRLVLDANGNYILEHRKGDMVRDGDGNTVPIPDGVDVEFRDVDRDQLGDIGVDLIVKDTFMVNMNSLEGYTSEAFNTIYHLILDEKMRRLREQIETDVEVSVSI